MCSRNLETKDTTTKGQPQCKAAGTTTGWCLSSARSPSSSCRRDCRRRTTQLFHKINGSNTKAEPVSKVSQASQCASIYNQKLHLASHKVNIMHPLGCSTSGTTLRPRFASLHGQPDHIWRCWCCPKRCENRTSGASLEWIPALCPWCNAGSVDNGSRASLARLVLLPHLLDHFRPRSLRNSMLLALAWECRTTQTCNAKVCLVWVRKTVAFSLPW